MKMKSILLAALALAGGAILWLAPHNLSAADTKSSGPKLLYYTCPMHPSVKVEKPGGCPICGMKLQPVYDKTAVTNEPPAMVNTNRSATGSSDCCSSDGSCCN